MEPTPQTNNDTDLARAQPRPSDDGSTRNITTEQDSYPTDTPNQETDVAHAAVSSPGKPQQEDNDREPEEEESPELRQELQKDASVLQEALLNTLQKIETSQAEHNQLDSNNAFLQKYIGELMSTSNITGQKK
ncbi:putative bzip transcription factor protein [Ceratocystis lukuohia]|uniref:Bzip transcription factor protein n=1 Tax=Ceratocystis lukuohia TaxID=2019550 RepID=A0ABR4MCZ6_9PEZI